MPITTAVQKYDLNFAMYFLSKEKIIFLYPFYANLCDQKLWITFFGKSPKSTHSKPLPTKVVRSCIWGGGGEVWFIKLYFTWYMTSQNYFNISFVIYIWYKQCLLYLTTYAEGNKSSIFKDITINCF